jgi:hypothetical protein
MNQRHVRAGDTSLKEKSTHGLTNGYCWNKYLSKGIEGGMIRKISGLIALVAFLLFDLACYYIRNVPVTSVKSRDRIVGVIFMSGKQMQFPKENLARIVENQIVLSPSDAVALSDVKNYKQDDKGVVYEITTKDGHIIRDIEGRKQGWKIVFPSQKYEPAFIPISQIKLVLVRRLSLFWTIYLGMGGIGFLGLLLISSTREKNSNGLISFW